MVDDTLSAPLAPYAHFFDLCTKAARRYGNTFSLPVAASPYNYLRALYNSRYPRFRLWRRQTLSENTWYWG
jgi:hypothetical protein